MITFQRINLILASITATLKAFKLILRCCRVRYMEMKGVPFIRYRTFSFIRLILQTASSQSSPVMKKICSIISTKWISAKRLAPFSMCCCESIICYNVSLSNTYLPSFYSTPPSDQTTVYLFMYLYIIYLSSITKPKSICISTNSPRYNGQHKRNTKFI